MTLKRKTKKLIKKINENTEKNTETFHIVGSGSSVLKTIKHIKNDDFVIGINFSLFLDITFDLHLIELTNENMKTGSMIGKLSFATLLEAINTGQVNFGVVRYDKNIIELNKKACNKIAFTEKQYMSSYIAKLPAMIKSLLFLFFNRELWEISTTVYTAMKLAYSLGAKRIYIHGFDGGGSHFYHNYDEYTAKKITAKDHKLLLEQIENSGKRIIQKIGKNKNRYLNKFKYLLMFVNVIIIDLSVDQPTKTH